MRRGQRHAQAAWVGNKSPGPPQARWHRGGPFPANYQTAVVPGVKAALGSPYPGALNLQGQKLLGGGLALGIVALDGLAMGGAGLGGVAIGVKALGGRAIGVYAHDGLAIGVYPEGGAVIRLFGR